MTTPTTDPAASAAEEITPAKMAAQDIGFILWHRRMISDRELEEIITRHFAPQTSRLEEAEKVIGLCINSLEEHDYSDLSTEHITKHCSVTAISTRSALTAAKQFMEGEG